MHVFTRRSLCKEVARPIRAVAWMIPAVLLLNACTQNPDGSTALGVKGSPAWFMTASPEAIAAHYRAVCQSYGHLPDTAGMAECIERSAQGDRVAGNQGMAAAASRVGTQPQSQSSTHRYIGPTGANVTCRTTAYGGTGNATTNCY